jgi:2-polyprenyl-3-methyl-5-hydroxy-6-metoxy-1,4-benzoquinol methylase
MQLNKFKFGILSTIGLSIGLVITYYSKIQSTPYHLVINCEASNIANSQLFFNIGEGYIERHSNVKLIEQNQTGELNFKLPLKKIYGLRFDPMSSDGSMEIRNISIQGKGNAHNENIIFHKFDLKNLLAVQEVDLVIKQSGNLLATTHQGCNDPIIELSLNEPLDHWQFTELLDMEWFKKSIFFALLITPITLSLSLSETKGNDINRKIIFRVKKQMHTLGVGETFRAKPENCYQDTSEENIRSVIEEIKNGTHWKQAVKEKYKEANPWLYEIVCSPQRTKFIDEYIKPKNFQILDIGAGWGQFTIPLAKQNQICSLEPTPERLDFIKAASKQEGVDQNISYIGADYLDVKFENKFDLILSIGVMEWVGAFKTDKPPEEVQKEYLSKIKTELKEYGRLVIGIENRLGLKYLLGARDDHHGYQDVMIYGTKFAQDFFGENYIDEKKCLVHSISDYKEILKATGFQKINFFVSIPDYKIIDKIYPIIKDRCSYNDFLLGGNWIIEHDGIDGSKLPNQEKLKHLYKSLAQMNVAHLFAPSFFIEAS